MSRPMPWLTLGVLGATLAVTGAMAFWPEVGEALQRSPEMAAGQYWRVVTAWLVQVDGPAQILFNGIGLLVFGSICEWRAGRLWWLAAYGVAGIAGEVAGIFWQPVGGGNSVAVLGLFALFAVSQLDRRDVPAPARALPLAVAGAGAVWLLTQRDIHGVALAAGLVLAGLRQGLFKEKDA